MTMGTVRIRRSAALAATALAFAGTALTPATSAASTERARYVPLTGNGTYLVYATAVRTATLSPVTFNSTVDLYVLGRTGTPRLLGVVRRPGVQHDGPALGHDAPGDGRSDGDATAGTRHDHDPVVQPRSRHRLTMAVVDAGSHLNLRALRCAGGAAPRVAAGTQDAGRLADVPVRTSSRCARTWGHAS